MTRESEERIRDAALAGLGVGLVPAFIVPQELRSGALKALDVGYEPEGADIDIAYPKDRTSSAIRTASKALLATCHRSHGNPAEGQLRGNLRRSRSLG